MTDVTVEAVIIGGGQAGIPLARALAERGRSVAVVEREHLGGSCVNFGCTPSKAMIASARVASDARRGSELGIHIPTVAVDFLSVMNRARRLVAAAKGSLDESIAADTNPQLVKGHGKLEGRDGSHFCVRVGDIRVLAAQAVLDTGTRTSLPKLDGLDQVQPITAENWIELRELPRRLLILGGSYIALEMAQAYRRLGSEVILLQQGKQIAEREDEDVAEALQRALGADGVDVRLNIEAERIEAIAGGVRIYLANGTVEGSDLFIATGRQPNTDDLGLDTVGVRVGKGGIIEVDGRLSTNVPGIWAAGDIRGGPAFTHTAYDDFKVLASQLLGDGSRKRGKIIPYAMFTDPELGRVGLTEREARNADLEIKVGRHAMVDSGKARELGKTAGFVKVIVDADSEKVLGATALCTEGSEVVQLFIELMNAGATVHTMLDAIHIHPTLAEAAKNAVASIRRREQ
jgi:pyruvate/2-oxoglutarate dehydrogenase complex dihydrolipoamide dehydrogenase (E3) component